LPNFKLVYDDSFNNGCINHAIPNNEKMQNLIKALFEKISESRPNTSSILIDGGKGYLKLVYTNEENQSYSSWVRQRNPNIDTLNLCDTM
jgi:hypothetical protein